MYSILSKGGDGKPFNHTVFQCDSVDDIALLPTFSRGGNGKKLGGCAAGSLAFVINGGKYILNAAGVWTELSGGGGDTDSYEVTTNKVTDVSEESTDTQYPSAKAVYEYVNEVVTGAIGGEY